MARSGPKRQSAKGGVRLTTPSSSPMTPPKPFTVAPANMTQFLDTLPKDAIYLTHIDHTSNVEKRQLFMAPAILNIIFAVLLVMRLYFAVPTYIALITAFLGLDSEARVDTAHTSTGSLLLLLGRRAGMIIFDYALYSLLGKWVLRFIVEEMAWRWSIGFNDVEVVVRVSKKWHESLGSSWSSEDERRIADKVMPELEERRIQKSSLQLADASFVLDTDSMVNAHALINRHDLSFEDFDRVVFAYYKPLDSWISWRLSQPSKTTEKEDTNLVKLRENLVAKGKEDLFFRYVEIVQYEASRPGGFLVGYQQKAWEELKKAFAEKGVDINVVRRELGGEKNMPFFEDAPQDHL